MAFGVTRDGHTIPGSGFNRFGGPRVVFTSPWYGHDDYYHSSYYGSRIGLLGGGITMLVLGVALAALGILAFICRDFPSGITFTAIGGITGLAGIVCIIAKFAMGKRY